MRFRHLFATGLLVATLWICTAAAADDVVSTPLTSLTSRAKRDAGPMFERVAFEQSGVRFINPIDNKHPMRRLYASSMACGGVAIGDVNGDGRPDLFFASGANPNRLFVQVGDADAMRFEDVTRSAGIPIRDNVWSNGVAMADVDNDGDLDIYVCNYESPNQLFINDGKGKFVDRAAAWGVGIVDASLMAAFADYDRDGDVDFYLTTNRVYRDGGYPDPPPLDKRAGKTFVTKPYQRYFEIKYLTDTKWKMLPVGRPDRLFRNNGKGKFIDVTESAGVAKYGHGNSATWWDYDQDGDEDLYVGNDFEDADRLYRNNGDGTFTDVIGDVVPHTTWFSMGADAGDLDGDGLPDFLMADMMPRTHFMQKLSMGTMDTSPWSVAYAHPPQIMRNALYVNTRVGRMLEGAQMAGLARSDWTWAVKFADFDNDGRLDVFLTNGVSRDLANSDLNVDYRGMVGKNAWDYYANLEPRNEPNVAKRNLGDLRFEDVGKAWGIDHNGMSYAAATGDLDGDGDLDLVVANLDGPAHIYRNLSSNGHRVMLRLRGTASNRFGLGARVTLTYGTPAQRQVRTLSPMTGFMSSNDPALHFGLGESDRIESVVIDWPSGRRQVLRGLAVDRLHTITEPGDSAAQTPRVSFDPKAAWYQPSDLLAKVSHLETYYDDFRRQPLLPNQLSQLGPATAWGDIDGDGDDDLYLGGARGQAGQIWRNDGGRFRLWSRGVFPLDREAEDMGAVFLDADRDSDLDLYVVSGGVETFPDQPVLRDRLYLNSGEGDFTRASRDVLPDVRDSGGPVVAADFDRDGDLDLFVGGRVVPGRYPVTPRSRLLRNDGDKDKPKFIDITDTLAPGVNETGLVTAALWSDADGDGWVDLLVAHEWGPIKLFRNVNGKLIDQSEAAGLATHTGWWNGLAGRDLDGDGDIDYVATNFGLNTKYHADVKHPALLYFGDMEGTGRLRLVEAEYEGDTLYPIRGRSCTTRAIPSLKDKFPTYQQFAIAPLADIYTPAGLQNATRLAATTLESAALINDGKGRFTLKPLPRLAQIAPGFGVVLTDVDADGVTDAIVAQNFYTPQIETGRMAGGLSIVLRGKGDGTFTPVRPGESGLVVPGDAKSLTMTDLNADGRPDVVVGQNNDKLLAFTRSNVANGKWVAIALRGPTGNATGVGARVTVTTSDGRKQSAEACAGSGYLSQSSSRLWFGVRRGETVTQVEVRWPSGQTTRVTEGLGGAVVVIDEESR